MFLLLTKEGDIEGVSRLGRSITQGGGLRLPWKVPSEMMPEVSLEGQREAGVGYGLVSWATRDGISG